MDRLTAMEVFVEAAERASLTNAAAALGMSRAMASRYLEWCERWLGVRLLHRTTRRISLTAAGTEAFERCKQVLEITHDVRGETLSLMLDLSLQRLPSVGRHVELEPQVDDWSTAVSGWHGQRS